MLVDSDRLPPCDTDAEFAVLGCALAFANHALALIGSLRADDFFAPEHREAWTAIMAVQARQMPVDVLSVADEVRARGSDERFTSGFLVWSTTAASRVPAWQNVGHYAGIVREKATLRRLISLAVEIQCAAQCGQRLEEVMTTAREGVAALEVDGAIGGPVRLGDALTDVVQVIEDRSSGANAHAVRTGISTADEKLGGLKPGQLVIVAARPGMGKTAWADNVATYTALNDVPTLFFSLEMSFQEIAERVLSLKSRVSASDLGTGRMDLVKWAKVTDASNRLQAAQFWIDDRELSLGRIVSEARRWHAKHVRSKAQDGEHPLGLVVIDYAQIVPVERESKGENREQQVGRVSRVLKGLAKSLRLPVILICQLNRDVEKRGGKPQPSDLRDSGSLEQDADVILFVWRDIDPADKSAQNENGDAELIIAKNRGGRTGLVPMKWVAQLMEFTAREDRLPEPPEDFHTRGDGE